MTTLQQVCELLEPALHHSSVIAAWLGYGNPLFLEFTNSSRRETDKPNVQAADCKLQTNFAAWSIQGSINGNSESDTRDRLESAAQSLIGAIVDDFEFSADAMLTIRFNETRLLKIVPWAVDDGHSDAWSMTVPDDRILSVSNAGQIAIVEGHIPIRDWFANNS